MFGGRKLCLVRSTWKMTYFLIIQTLKHCFEQTWYCSSLARLTAALLTQFTDCRELAEATTTTKSGDINQKLIFFFVVVPNFIAFWFNLVQFAKWSLQCVYKWTVVVLLLTVLVAFFSGLHKLPIVCLAARAPQISDVRKKKTFKIALIISRKLKVS